MKKDVQLQQQQQEDREEEEEVEVIKVVLCAGLYPQLARVHLPAKQYYEVGGAKDVKLFLQQQGQGHVQGPVADTETKTAGDEGQQLLRETVIIFCVSKYSYSDVTRSHPSISS
jgi:hypothetical protein